MGSSLPPTGDCTETSFCCWKQVTTSQVVGGKLFQSNSSPTWSDFRFVQSKTVYEHRQIVNMLQSISVNLCRWAQLVYNAPLCNWEFESIGCHLVGLCSYIKARLLITYVILQLYHHPAAPRSLFVEDFLKFCEVLARNWMHEVNVTYCTYRS